jgi:putative transposase
MARQPRFVLPGHPQHVIVRGVNREAIFCTDDDYRFFLDKLGDALKKFDCQLHAYVLMTNHVHLLISPSRDDGISKVMQNVGRYYVQYFNFTYQRTGTLFEGRYKASLIDSERYLLVCYRYIELNPVRANMVAHPAEYPWSSFHVNGLGYVSALIEPHGLYLALGNSGEVRAASYRALFAGHVDERALTEIREATNKCWVLGSDYFKEQIAGKVARKLEPDLRGGDRRSKSFNRV